MFAGTKPKLHDKPQLNLKIDGHDIANVSKQKLLGCYPAGTWCQDDVISSSMPSHRRRPDVIRTSCACWVIDNTLSWSAHIDNLCSSLSSKISLLRQLAYYVSEDVLKKFYQGYTPACVNVLIDYA